MAEQVVWNKKLLIVSLLMGVVAVALFYMYASVQKKRIRGEMIEVLKWRRDMKAGERIVEDDVEVMALSTKAANFEGFATADHLETIVIDGTLSESVTKGRFVLISAIIDPTVRRPSDAIGEGKVAFPLYVDPNYTPGEMLRQGDRVNLLGVVRVGGRSQTHTLIGNLRVLEVGGRSTNPDRRYEENRGRPKGQRSIRKISVEVSSGVALELNDLLMRVQGQIRVVVRNRADRPDKKLDGKINPDLAEVLRQPAPEG